MSSTTPAETGAVVVGVDGSESALRAVRWAAVEARNLRCPLRLVHATVWPLVTHPVPPGVPGHYRAVMVEAGRGWLQEAREIAEHTAPGIQAHEHLLTGGAGPVLLAESGTAREIVVGSRGLGGFTGMLIGSVAGTLAQHAECPVVVVREEGDPAGPIVVGVDGSAAGEKALGYAFDAASRAEARLIAIHTWSDIGLGELWAPPASGLDWELIEREAQQLLTDCLAEWREKYPDVVVQRVVEQDRPAHRLREAARGARLLVVGSRGRGGFTGLLLGSTSRTLVQHAPCPVVVVRS